MLERIEGEVGEAGHVLAWGPYAEDAAVIMRMIISEEFLVGQCYVWLRDGKHTLTVAYFYAVGGPYPRCGEHI